jgi:hypothetical protein
VRLELALFSSLGPPLELRELALLKRSKPNTSSTPGQIHPETLTSLNRVFSRFGVPECPVINAVSNKQGRCSSQKHRPLDQKTLHGRHSQKESLYTHVTP